MNQQSHTPLLSICIPTYNRAELLRLALLSLISQVRELNDEVELVVSDNCSPDHTQEVVQWAQQQIPIRYHRNNENIGVARNILVATNELAKGEFCWIIGDDDMVIKGKVAKLINIIRANPDLDYFFVNYFNKQIQERNRLILERDSFYIPEKGESAYQDFSERRLSKWEDLLDIDGQPAPYMYTYIGCNIFRRSLWCANVHLLRINKDKHFLDFDTTFPHVKVLAHAMVGRPAYFIGDPMVLLGIGAQQWAVHWEPGSIALMPYAFRMYESLGVKASIVRRLELWLLDHKSFSIACIVAGSDLSSRKYFSLRKFLWVNKKYPRKTVMLLALVVILWIYFRIPNPIRTAVKSTLNRTGIFRKLRKRFV